MNFSVHCEDYLIVRTFTKPLLVNESRTLVRAGGISDGFSIRVMWTMDIDMGSLTRIIFQRLILNSLEYSLPMWVGL